MQESSIIAALVYSREAYEKVAQYLQEKDFTAKGWVIVGMVKDYYAQDAEATQCDPEILLARIKRRLRNPKAYEGFESIFARLLKSPGSTNVVQEVLQNKRAASAERLVAALSSPAEGDREAIKSALQEFNELNDATSLTDETVGAEEIDLDALFTKKLSEANRIKVAPAALNDKLGGGAFPGHCIIVFGRVEMGKSLNAINAAAGFVAQGLRTLYIENEDSFADTQKRFLCRLLNRPASWVKANLKEAISRANKLGLHNFLLANPAPETPQQVQALFDKYKPRVCVVNQMRNMAHSGNAENAVSKLDKIAHELRNVGKRNDVLMYMITAAREADNGKDGYAKEKHILELSDVYSSRTGIPAAADVLIGWGGSQRLKQQNMACINVCKNKVSDSEVYAEKYGHIYVNVNPLTGKITGSNQ